MGLSTSQDHPNVRIPPPLIFFGILIIASVAEHWFRLDFPKGPFVLRGSIALILFILAGYMALHAFVVLKRRGTFIDPKKPTTEIVEDGPFKISRNPMYLALVLLFLGLSALYVSFWFFLSAVGLWILFDRTTVPAEEAYLKRKFGERFKKYESKVRRWI